MIDAKQLAAIERESTWMARRLPPGAMIDAEDLRQEAIVEILRGRKSIHGPMLDAMRKQGIVGQSRANYRHSDLKRVAMPNLSVPPHEARVIAFVDCARLLRLLTPKQQEAIVSARILGMTEGERTANAKTSLHLVRWHRAAGMRSLRRMVA